MNEALGIVVGPGRTVEHGLMTRPIKLREFTDSAVRVCVTAGEQMGSDLGRGIPQGEEFSSTFQAGHEEILSVGMVERPTVAAGDEAANPVVSRITCALCERRMDRGVNECVAVDCPHGERCAA